MAEKKYIESEYVLKCMEDSYKNAGISAEAASKVRKWLYKAPAADVREVKRGKWQDKRLDKFRKYEVVCSECGAKYIGNYDAYDEPYDFNFCPNCGAMMEES